MVARPTRARPDGRPPPTRQRRMTHPPFDDFEERAIDAIEKAQRRHAVVALLPLLAVIGLLIALGITSAVFSVKGARSQSAASKADVERNAGLTRQLTTL